MSKSKSIANVFLINVGLNSEFKTFLKSGMKFPPIFEDNSFVFIPIPEGDEVTEDGITYENLNLGKWMREPELHAHNDPEFETFTYGDYSYKPSKGNLTRAERGDYLVFFSSFQKLKNNKATDDCGFFIIGYFELEEIYNFDEILDNSSEEEINEFAKKVANNAHFKRVYDESFTIWQGSKNSKKLKKGIPLNAELVKKILRRSDGSEINFDRVDKNGNRISEFSIINSNTKAIRMIPPERAKYLWDEIANQD